MSMRGCLGVSVPLRGKDSHEQEENGAWRPHANDVSVPLRGKDSHEQGRAPSRSGSGDVSVPLRGKDSHERPAS